MGANGIHEIKNQKFDWILNRFDKFEEETPFYPADDPHGTGTN